MSNDDTGVISFGGVAAMGKRPTIRDVTKLAGVSVKTVSRVLNGAPHVSDETRIRVLQAIEELHYRPNMAARALAGRRARGIGVIVGHEAQLVFSNPLLFEVLGGIGSAASSFGYQVVLLTDPSGATSTDILASGHVSGVIVMSVGTRDPIVKEIVERLGYPVAATCPVEDPRVPCVDVDNFQGAAMAVQHLVSYGHRDIGFIGGPPDHGTSKARLQGYTETLEKAGIPCRPELVLHGDFTERSGLYLARGLLMQHPEVSAVFAAGDLMAIGTIRAAHELNRRVPEDLSVVGFDDISSARYLQPPLTTVKQHAFEKGQMAAQMILRMVRGESVAPRVTLAPELSVRGSTQPRNG